MTLEEKERAIEGFKFPWPNIAHVFRETKNDMLRLAEDDQDRERIQGEYGRKISELFSVQPR